MQAVRDDPATVTPRCARRQGDNARARIMYGGLPSSEEGEAATRGPGDRHSRQHPSESVRPGVLRTRSTASPGRMSGPAAGFPTAPGPALPGFRGSACPAAQARRLRRARSSARGCAAYWRSPRPPWAMCGSPMFPARDPARRQPRLSQHPAARRAWCLAGSDLDASRPAHRRIHPQPARGPARNRRRGGQLAGMTPTHRHPGRHGGSPAHRSQAYGAAVRPAPACRPVPVRGLGGHRPRTYGVSLSA